MLSCSGGLGRALLAILLSGVAALAASSPSNTASGPATAGASANTPEPNQPPASAALAPTTYSNATNPRASTANATVPAPWPDYQVFMWMGDSAYRKPDKIPLFFERLREIGITAGMVYGQGSPEHLLSNQMPFYVENVVNRGLCLKFNSKVTDWEKVVTDWAKNGRPESALVRDYCLDSPEWLDYAAKEMREAAARNAPHRPLAYDIRDELSTTISANPFDYDFNELTLAKFRNQLLVRYGSLTNLNRAWGTAFARLEDVRPFTTDRIKQRMATGAAMPGTNVDWHAVAAIQFHPATARAKPAHWNFAPWCDFRSYMDASLANALEHIRAAGRQVDPRAPIGIEGTQMPHAFGGYDLWRLSQVLDWVEPYDIGNAREIFGSFMPGKTLITTVFENSTDAARRRLWHLLLEGDRGCIIWWSEDSLDYTSPDYALTAKARALAPVLKELRSPLARMFMKAERVADPVYLHYSQPSIQVNWLLESTVDGSTWLRRFSSHEASHNRMAKLRNSWLKAFQDLGFSPQFVSSEQVEAGLLANAPSNSVLVLPTSFAMSDREVAAVKHFAGMSGQGQTHSRPVYYDGYPGAFDEHGKLRLEPAFPEPPAGFTGASVLTKGTTPLTHSGEFWKYQTARVTAEPAARDWSQWIAHNIDSLKPEVTIPGFTATRVHRFKLPKARLLAFERNINYQMSEELKQAGGNQGLEKPVEISPALAEPRHIYELWTGRYIGHTRSWTFQLEPWRPALFAVLEARLPEGADVVSALQE